MGAGASVTTLFSDDVVSADCKKFIDLHLAYTPVSERGKQLRNAAWKAIDVNGNGHVCLAEVGKWIQQSAVLSLIEESKPADRGTGKTCPDHPESAEIKAAQEEGVRLYKVFYPAYIRAFLDAADIGKNKKIGGTKTATTDDYVQRKEFRYLNVYLCIYALMYDAFNKVDGCSAGRTKDDDRRISKAELEKACDGFKGHPLLGVKMMGMPEKDYGNIGNIFAEMDSDNKGMVLLKEWCEWMEKQEITHGTEFGQLLAHGDDRED